MEKCWESFVPTMYMIYPFVTKGWGGGIARMYHPARNVIYDVSRVYQDFSVSAYTFDRNRSFISSVVVEARIKNTFNWSTSHQTKLYYSQYRSNKKFYKYIVYDRYLVLCNMYPQTPLSLWINVLICSYCNTFLSRSKAPNKNPQVCYSRRKITWFFRDRGVWGYM